LLGCFPEIRRQIPGARLQVFSSMKVYQISGQKDQESYGALYEKCRATEGVEYIGSVPQPELAQTLPSVAALAYPNTFAETSCIAVMEAMACGCRIITSDLGALPETTAGFGQLLQLVGVDRDVYVRQFTQATVAALRESMAADPSAEALLRRQVDFVNRSYTWRARAGEWTNWLASLSGAAPRPASGLGSCSIRLA
jgi:protein O-GlcNAc transferase